MAVVAQLCTDVSNVKSLFLVYVLGKVIPGVGDMILMFSVLCFQNHVITFMREQHIVLN